MTFHINKPDSDAERRCKGKRDVENSHNTESSRRLGDKFTEQSGEPSKEPHLQQQPLAPNNHRRLGDKCRQQLGKPSKEPFLKHQPFASEDGRKLGEICKEELLGGTLQRTFKRAPPICLRRWYETGRHM